MSAPQPPIELTGTASRLDAPTHHTSAALIAALADICEVQTDVAATAEASRDWWPIALHWALAGEVPARAAAVARPRSTAEVSAVMRLCNEHGTPVTAAGGRSGVAGASVPVYGGVVLDLTALRGVVDVDQVSGVVEVLPGTFGPELEAELGQRHGLTVRHLPQSFELSTVGGWVACRGAGQYSTRYGKIEDMVVGLEVVLADGSVITTGGAPAAATGPDLNHLFIGSEGTLGVITRVWLRTHPLPEAEERAAYRFASFADGVETCRRAVQAGATPAVLRLYDAAETARSHGGDGQHCVLLVLDEGPATMVRAVMEVVDRFACELGEPAPAELVDHWFEHRNDTSALQALTRRGIVVDTMEVAAPWALLETIRTAVAEALMQVPHARAASCHLSHSYPDGACLYFSFAATPPPDEIDRTYRALWDAGQRAALYAGANLAHHHGIGLNRARFAAEALGPAHAVLGALKTQLDPGGILNPGKLGLPHPFGPEAW